jgi:hypothetical protein
LDSDHYADVEAIQGGEDADMFRWRLLLYHYAGLKEAKIASTIRKYQQIGDNYVKGRLGFLSTSSRKIQCSTCIAYRLLLKSETEWGLLCV